MKLSQIKKLIKKEFNNIIQEVYSPEYPELRKLINSLDDETTMVSYDILPDEILDDLINLKNNEPNNPISQRISVQDFGVLVRARPQHQKRY